MLNLKSALMWGNWTDNATSPKELLALSNGVLIYGNANSTTITAAAGGANSGQFDGTIYTSHLNLGEIAINGRAYLVSTGHYFQDALVYGTIDGALNSPTSLLGAGGLVGAISSYQSPTGTHLYTISRKSAGVDVWSGSMATGWHRTQQFSLADWKKTTNLSDMVQVGNTLYAASHSSNTLNSMHIRADGQLEIGTTIDIRDGLMVERPSKMVHLELAGQNYLVLAASGSNSLSVVEIGAHGQMRVTDQIMDTLGTRFETPGHLEAFSVGGRPFVLAAGGDKGLSIFAILPTGRLEHVASLADTVDITLDQITDTEVVVHSDKVEIFVSSASEAGVTRLVFDIDSTGIMTSGPGAHQGGAGDDIIGGDHGNNELRGGGGKDRLLDGAGNDHMYGEQGADTFSLSADAHADYIHDFDRHEDVIDLSAWGVRSGRPIAHKQTPNGVEIRFGPEVLYVTSSDGAPIDLASLRPEWLKVSNAGVNITNRPGELPQPPPPPVIPNPNPPSQLPALDYITAGENARYGAEGADVIQGSANDEILSGEARAGQVDEDIGTIVRFYRAALDRLPDPDGLGFYRRGLSSGLVAEDMARDFLSSIEFRSRFPDVSNEAYIKLLYTNTLDRLPDQGGLNFWIGHLAKPSVDRSSVFMGFVDSRELRNKMETTTIEYSWAAIRQNIADDVFRIYQATLDRAPDLEGYLFWTDYLADGNSFDDIIARFTQSPEFLTRFGNMDDARFVELLYNNILGRAPDSGGFAFHMGRLTSHEVTREQTVETFSQSPEFQQASLPFLTTWLRSQGGGDRLISNGGNDIMFGGILADSFVFDKHKPSRAIIKDFEPWDYLELKGFDYLNAQEALDHITAGPDGLLFADQGVEITLQGLSPGDLDASSFSVA